jgi:hypothetical protein
MSLSFLAGYVLGEHGRQSARLASQAGARIGPSNDDLFGIEDRVDRLILIVAAVWSLLEEQGLTEEQLHERIRALDEADGVPDGKMTPQPTTCTSCGAKVGAGLTACQFCGTAVAVEEQPGPFDKV